MKKYRVFIVDDHPLMRIALGQVINAVSDLEVVGEAVQGAAALEAIPALKPDIVIMDLLMPKMDGLTAIRLLKQQHPEIAILVLSSATDDAKISQAMKLGAAGYLTKGSQREDLITAMRTVAGGEVYLPPDIARKLLSAIRQPSAQAGPGGKLLEPFTPRQQEIFNLLGQGFTDPEIGQQLHIAPSTVRGHLRIVMQKLGFENRRELMFYALRQPVEGAQ
jgi:DNA-binding NarL/FixJ family response regulator